MALLPSRSISRVLRRRCIVFGGSNPTAAPLNQRSSRFVFFSHLRDPAKQSGAQLGHCTLTRFFRRCQPYSKKVTSPKTHRTREDVLPSISSSAEGWGDNPANAAIGGIEWMSDSCLQMEDSSLSSPGVARLPLLLPETAVFFRIFQIRPRIYLHP